MSKKRKEQIKSLINTLRGRLSEEELKELQDILNSFPAADPPRDREIELSTGKIITTNLI